MKKDNAIALALVLFHDRASVIKFYDDVAISCWPEVPGNNYGFTSKEARLHAVARDPHAESFTPN